MGCRQRFPVASGRLARVVARPDGSVAEGPTLPGRGAWVCRNDPSCLHRALKRKNLSKALRSDIGPDAAALLHEELRRHFPAARPDARD